MTNEAFRLQGARVLLLEDEYYLAMDIQDALEQAGATVIGPFAAEAEAKQAVVREKPDCAFIDVNLGQGPSFELPRALAGRQVPFAFFTGYDSEAITEEFADTARYEKPLDLRKVPEAVERLLKRA